MSTNNENFKNILGIIDKQIDKIIKVREDGNKLQKQKLGELNIINNQIENKYTELNRLLNDIYSVNVTMVEVLDTDKSDRFFIDIRYTERENVFKRIKLSDYRKVLKKSEDEVNDFFKEILEYLLGSIVAFNCGEEEIKERIEDLKNKYKSKAEQEANSIMTELASLKNKKDKLIYLTQRIKELKNNEKSKADDEESKAEQEANSIITELAQIKNKKDKIIHLTQRIEELKNNEKSKAEDEKSKAEQGKSNADEEKSNAEQDKSTADEVANSIITELANIEDKKDKLIYLTRMVVAYAVKTKEAYTFEYETLGWRNFGKEEKFLFANKMIYCAKSDIEDEKYKIEDKNIICVNDYSEYIKIEETSDEAFDMIAELMNYDKGYPRIILSAALSGIIRQKLRLNNEAGININIQGGAGTGKTTIQRIALGMFGSADDLIGSFTNTNNSIDVSRVNKGVIPYVMDEQMIKYIDKSDKAKSKGIIIDIFRNYSNKVKETSHSNRYSGRLAYGAYISSSVEKIFDIITSRDFGQFRRLIELNITKDSLFCDSEKETVSSKIKRYEKIVSANSGYFIKEFIETIIRLETEKPEELIYKKFENKDFPLHERVKFEKGLSNKKDIGFIEKLYESWLYEIEENNKIYKQFTKEKIMNLEGNELKEEEAEDTITNIQQLVKMSKRLALLATTCEIALITLMYKHIEIATANKISEIENNKTVRNKFKKEINKLMPEGINVSIQKTRDMIDILESNILASFKILTKKENEANKELIFLYSENDINIFCNRLEAMLKDITGLNLKYKDDNIDANVLIHNDKDGTYTFLNEDKGHNQMFKTGTRVMYQYLVNEVAKTIYITDEMELKARNDKIIDELRDIVDRKEKSHFYIKTEELMKKYVRKRPKYLTPGETSKTYRAVHYSTNSCVTISVSKLRKELQDDLNE